MTSGQQLATGHLPPKGAADGLQPSSACLRETSARSGQWPVGRGQRPVMRGPGPDHWRLTTGNCLSWLAEEDQLPGPVLEFARRITEGVTGRRPELDEMIQRYAPAWPVSQLAAVDRNTLRIALYELLHSPDTPRRTAVNEAVDLAKEFGSESSGRFVNGVLGSVMAELDSVGLASV